MKIQNFDQLATTPARQALLTIAEAGLQAIDTGTVIHDTIRCVKEMRSRSAAKPSILQKMDRLVFVAVGKCAADAAMAAEDILGDRIARGVVLDVKKCPRGEISADILRNASFAVG